MKSKTTQTVIGITVLIYAGCPFTLAHLFDARKEHEPELYRP